MAKIRIRANGWVPNPRYEDFFYDTRCKDCAAADSLGCGQIRVGKHRVEFWSNHGKGSLPTGAIQTLVNLLLAYQNGSLGDVKLVEGDGVPTYAFSVDKEDK